MTGIITAGNFWFNIAETQRSTVLQRMGANLMVDYPANIKELWNRIKTNPKTPAEVVTVNDLYLLIANEINFAEIDNPPALKPAEKPHDNLLADRKPFFQWLEANENARKVLYALLTGTALPHLPQINAKSGELDRYITPVKGDAVNKLKTAMQNNDQFARELFLLAPKTAALFPADELVALMLQNRGAAMAIAQNSELAEKVRDKLSADQVVELLAKSPKENTPWQENGAYHAALLNFLLQYNRNALDEAQLLPALNRKFEDQNAKKKNAAIQNLQKLLYSGKYSAELAQTIANDTALAAQLYASPVTVTSLVASVANPLQFLQTQTQANWLTNSHLLHAMPVVAQRVSSKQLQNYLNAGERNQKPIDRLHASLNFKNMGDGDNWALSNNLNNPQLYTSLNLSDESKYSFLDHSEFNPEFCKSLALKSVDIAEFNDQVKAKSDYITAAAVMSAETQKESVWFWQGNAVKCQQYFKRFVAGNNLDQTVCELMASHPSYRGLIREYMHVPMHVTFFGLFNLWARDEKDVAAERAEKAKKSPFFIRGKALVQQALDPASNDNFIAAIKGKGKDVVIYRLLMAATEKDLIELKKIDQINTAIVQYIKSVKIADLPIQALHNLKTIAAYEEDLIEYVNSEKFNADLAAYPKAIIRLKGLFPLPANDEKSDHKATDAPQMQTSPAPALVTAAVVSLPSHDPAADAGLEANAQSDEKQPEPPADNEKHQLIPPDGMDSDTIAATVTLPFTSPTKSQLDGVRTVDPTPVKVKPSTDSTAACIAQLADGKQPPATPQRPQTGTAENLYATPQSQSSAQVWKGAAAAGSTHATPQSQTSAAVAWEAPVPAIPLPSRNMTPKSVVSAKSVASKGVVWSGGKAAGSTQASPESVSSAILWTGDKTPQVDVQANSVLHP